MYLIGYHTAPSIVAVGQGGLCDTVTLGTLCDIGTDTDSHCCHTHRAWGVTSNITQCGSWSAICVGNIGYSDREQFTLKNLHSKKFQL